MTEPESNRLDERERFLWQVWLQQMQQVAWLAAAGAGAALIFVERVAQGKPRRAAILSFILFALAAAIAVFGQSREVEALWDNRAVKPGKAWLPVAYTIVGAGAGAFIVVVTS
ncbi:MAG TPA: hypothetical protein VG106_05565 [Vicinamibacterales bacterium]|nr:hypothetical protein [Vicinamibacterales bacterium]